MFISITEFLYGLVTFRFSFNSKFHLWMKRFLAVRWNPSMIYVILYYYIIISRFCLPLHKFVWNRINHQLKKLEVVLILLINYNNYLMQSIYESMRYLLRRKKMWNLVARITRVIIIALQVLHFLSFLHYIWFGERGEGNGRISIVWLRWIEVKERKMR